MQLHGEIYNHKTSVQSSARIKDDESRDCAEVSQVLSRHMQNKWLTVKKTIVWYTNDLHIEIWIMDQGYIYNTKCRFGGEKLL